MPSDPLSRDFQWKGVFVTAIVTAGEISLSGPVQCIGGMPHLDEDPWTNIGHEKDLAHVNARPVAEWKRLGTIRLEEAQGYVADGSLRE